MSRRDLAFLQMNAPQVAVVDGVPLACPACGQTTGHPLRFEVNGCRILQCEKCGLGRTEAAGFDPATYYTEDYFSGRRADGYADYLGAEPVLRREFARSVDFIRHYRTGGSCWSWGAPMASFSWRPRGTSMWWELNWPRRPPSIAAAPGLNVVQGAADEANLAKVGHADVIVLFDVIEHLPDPRRTLALCHQHLNPGGVIVITTGDFGSVIARLAGVKWRLMTPPQHLWFFTQESFRHCFRATGPCRGARGPSLEDRSGFADRIPAAANAGACGGRRRGDRQSGWACPSTCSTRCVLSCESAAMTTTPHALPQIALLPRIPAAGRRPSSSTAADRLRLGSMNDSRPNRYSAPAPPAVLIRRWLLVAKPRNYS